MLTVGICGRIGSGKTEVARVFDECGAVVISADEIGRQVVENDAEILQALVREFGDKILDSEDHLVRRELGRRAFDRERLHASRSLRRLAGCASARWWANRANRRHAGCGF